MHILKIFTVHVSIVAHMKRQLNYKSDLAGFDHASIVYLPVHLQSAD